MAEEVDQLAVAPMVRDAGAAVPNGAPPSRPAVARALPRPPSPATAQPVNRALSGRPTTDRGPGLPVPAPEGDDGVERGATGPQLRRFIKSRAYVPMHELRRRFAINGHDDDVTPVDLDRRRVFVGLPDREGRLLADLLRGGDIGYELSMDPISPIVVGVYPMRPVTRP